MTIGEKIAKNRKENNYTQEQLAEILGVSRQSVSKWESDIAYPETEKLIKLSKLFECSTDYLLNDDITDKVGAQKQEQSVLYKIDAKIKSQIRERKSEKTVFGMPLYHIARNAKGFFAIGMNAKGIFSIGLKAQGIVTLGLLSVGIISVGVLALGLLAIANFAIGLISIGAIALGIFSLGAISIGIIAIGALSVGVFSSGALAIGRYIAVGDHARAMIAIGKTEAIGSIYHAVNLDVLYIKELLDKNVPEYLSWAKEIFKFIVL